MLFLTTLLTKKTTSSFVNPNELALSEAKQLLHFLENVQPSKMSDGFSFHIEAAKDGEERIYRDIDLKVDSLFILENSKYFVSTSGIAVNVQPLINFLQQVAN